MKSKKSIATVFLTLIPVLILMITIFYFSAQEATVSHRSSSGIVSKTVMLLYPRFRELDEAGQALVLRTITFLVRKGAHLTEYLLLGLALAAHIRAISACREIAHPHVMAYGIGTLYAVTDELHQLFVPGRSGEVRDMLLDSFGVLLGVLLIRLLAWLRDKGRQAV